MLSLSLDFAVGDFQVLGQRRLAGLHAHDLLQVGAIKVELAHNYRRTAIARDVSVTLSQPIDVTPKLCETIMETWFEPGLIRRNPDSWCIGTFFSGCHENER